MWARYEYARTIFTRIVIDAEQTWTVHIFLPLYICLRPTTGRLSYGKVRAPTAPEVRYEQYGIEIYLYIRGLFKTPATKRFTLHQCWLSVQWRTSPRDETQLFSCYLNPSRLPIFMANDSGGYQTLLLAKSSDWLLTNLGCKQSLTLPVHEWVSNIRSAIITKVSAGR